MRLAIYLLTLVLAGALSVSAAGITVKVRYDAKVPTLDFACAELKNALVAAKTNPVLTPFGQKPPSTAGWTIMIGLQPEMKKVDASLGKLKLVEEGFAIRPVAGKKLIYVVGADARGAMYGALDITEHVELGGKLADVKAKVEKPAMPMRALKINMPNWDSQEIEESWKDDWEWFLGPEYWTRFFRMMARNRYNICSIWHTHPYAWMARIPKYPEANMLSDAEMERFMKGYHFIFAEAARCGVDTYLITWNIHYPPAFAKKHGLQMWGQDHPVIRDYMREAIKAVLKEYPGLTGIGTCPGEAMHGSAAENEAWLMDTYVPALLEMRGPSKFIHRYWGSEPKPMQEVFAAHYPGKTYLDLKYNGESMYSSPDPHFVDPVWLNQKPRNYDILWHLRNDDIYVIRWGDPQFVRGVMKHCVGPGVAGYVTGSEYERAGPDRFYTDYAKEYQTWKEDFEKQWYRFMLWGKLSYNPTLPDSYFVRVFKTRFGVDTGQKLLKAMHTASKVIPLVDSFHWNYMNFDWAVEACMNPNAIINTARDGKGRYPNWRDLGVPGDNFNDIREWIFNWTIDDDEYIGIPEFVGNLMAGVTKGPGEEKRLSPTEVAGKLDQYASEVESILKSLKLSEGAPAYKEAVTWEWDLRLTALLARYYAEKTRGGTDLLYYWCTGDQPAQDRAVALLTNALKYWKQIAELTTKVYKMPDVSIYPQMSWARYVRDAQRDVETAKGPRPFGSKTQNCSVLIPDFANQAEIEQFEKQIATGSPLPPTGVNIVVPEVDTSNTGGYYFWLNSHTNRKASYLNFRRADPNRETGIGYCEYPLPATGKRWCTARNELGRVDMLWYNGKLVFDLRKQSEEELKKGISFQVQPGSGRLVARCDGLKGQDWGCSLRSEFKSTMSIVAEAGAPYTVTATIKNSFPEAELKDVMLTAILWSSGWEVTPATKTLNVKDDADAKFTLKRADPSAKWPGLTIEAEINGEKVSAGAFPDVPDLRVRPAADPGDGLWRAEMVDGKWAMVSQPELRHAYIYFDVQDGFLTAPDQTVTLIVEYYDPGYVMDMEVQYDSSFQEDLDGMFHNVKFSGTGEKGWRTQSVVLPRARFTNRSNGADFRLTSRSGAIKIGQVDVAK